MPRTENTISKNSHEKNCRALIISCIFFMVISLPALFLLCGIKGPVVPLSENRNPYPFPSLNTLSLRYWPKEIDRYVGDNLPFRTLFIGSYMRLFEWYLHSPVRNAVRGKKYGLYSIHLVKAHSGIYSRITQTELYLRRALFAGRHAFFNRQGIPWLLVIPPDKETILGDDLPAWFQELQKKSDWQRLKPLLESAKIPFLSFEKVFSTNKKLFYNQKKDLYHWNARGYVAAHEALQNRIIDIFRERERERERERGLD